MDYFRGNNTLLTEATLSKLSCLPSETESTPKGMNLILKKANPFLLEKTALKSSLVCRIRMKQKMCPMERKS